MAARFSCRLCGHGPLVSCMTLERSPRDVSRLLLPGETAADRPVTVEVSRCEHCGHVQLSRDPEPTYYDDYLMTTSHSPQMRAFMEQQAGGFIERFGLAGKRVIEVGCGDGHYIGVLRALGAEASGIEPSARFRDLAVAAGHDVAHGYVTAANGIPGAPYDGFVTRQVLEHVPDPSDFLAGIRSSLSADGVGLIEVPSLEQALEQHRFYDFFPDHVNYWSVGTLAGALVRAGFLVLEVTRAMGGEYLQAIVRVDEGRDFAALSGSVERISVALRELLAGCEADGRRVAAWGSGAKGLASLAEAGGDGIAYVVDSDAHKQGRLTPVTHLPVTSPERLREDPVDVVLVTALAYRDEIVAQLRGPIGFAGTIVVLGDPLERLEA